MAHNLTLLSHKVGIFAPGDDVLARLIHDEAASGLAGIA